MPNYRTSATESCDAHAGGHFTPTDFTSSVRLKVLLFSLTLSLSCSHMSLSVSSRVPNTDSGAPNAPAAYVLIQRLSPKPQVSLLADRRPSLAV